MDTLKKFFPLSFKYTGSVANLIIGILVYILVGIIAGALIGLASFITVWIPFLGPIICWLLRIVGSLVEIYVVAGIIIQVLSHCKVLK